MDALNLFLHTLHLSKPKVDIISELPQEMSQLILRKLDPESLLRAAQVSRSWLNICQSDPCLRNTAKQYKDAKKLELEKVKEIADSVSLDKENTIKQLNNYYNSCDYTQCSNVYGIVCRINNFSHRNQLDRIDECSNVRFY